jgi:hypothetical protein
MKAGAWTPCPACSYQPRSIEEPAKALMLSDCCIAPDTLAQFSARRQQGEAWRFGPELLEMFKRRVAAMIPLNPDGLPAQIESGVPLDDAAPPTDTGPNPPPGNAQEHDGSCAKNVRNPGNVD